MHRSLRLVGLAALSALLVPAAPLTASLVPTSPDATSGTGLGAVNTVLTVQNEPTESGCVGFDGTSDVTGPAACPPGIPGGDETAITETRTIGELGLESAFNLRVVFNFNEDNTDAIDLEDLILRIFSPSGALLFSSEPFTPVTFAEPFSGTGTAGFVFRLDAEQAAEANAFFDDPNNRIGLAAELGRTSAGSETFFVGDATNLGGPLADLALTKTDDPDPVAVGNTLTYTLTVENLGPNPATDVVVTDTLPASVTPGTLDPSQGTCSRTNRVVTCELGDLGSGASATIEITVTPTTDGQITNTAAVTSDTADPDGSNNTASEETTVGAGSEEQVDLTLTKSDSPDPVVVGGTLTYTITVTNGGLFNAQGVTVTDDLPSSLGSPNATSSQGSCDEQDGTVVCELGFIASGSSASIEITGTPQQEGILSNTAIVSAEESDPDTSDNSHTEQTQVIGTAADAADLSLVKNDSADPVAQGATFSYTLTVSNAGPDAAENVTVVDNLPAQATFVSATSPAGNCTESGGTVTCDLGTLASGSSAEVTITVTAPNADTVITNSAVASSDTADPDPADNDAVEQTSVGSPGTEVADLRVRKDDAPDPVPVEGSLTYTIVVTNGGPDTASGVTVVDNLPATVTFVSATPMGCTETGGNVVCDLGTLSAHTSETVTITVEPQTAGTINNTVSVSADQADPNTDNNSANEQTQVGTGAAPSVDLTVTKSDSPDPVSVGSTLTYTIVVGNAGGASATDVELTDVLPPSLSFSGVDSSQGTCSESGGVVGCELGTLGPGETATVTITAEPTMTGTIVNTASVSSNQTESDDTDNVAEEETTVGPAGGGDVVPIPTASDTALALLALLLALAGSLALLRRA